MFLLILLNHLIKQTQFFCCKSVADILFEFSNPLVIDHFSGGKFHHFNLLPGRTFDGIQHPFFTGCNKQNSVTFTTRTSRSTNTMHIGFRIMRNIIIQHVADTFYIQPSCSYICGHQNIQLSLLQIFNSTFTLTLLDISIER